MIVVMHEQATEAAIAKVAACLTAHGLRVHRLDGLRTALGAPSTPDGPPGLAAEIAAIAGVREVLRQAAPYELASRQCQPADYAGDEIPAAHLEDVLQAQLDDAAVFSGGDHPEGRTAD